jgi:hypothetical protein
MKGKNKEYGNKRSDCHHIYPGSSRGGKHYSKNKEMMLSQSYKRRLDREKPIDKSIRATT